MQATVDRSKGHAVFSGLFILSAAVLMMATIPYMELLRETQPTGRYVYFGSGLAMFVLMGIWTKGSSVDLGSFLAFMFFGPIVIIPMVLYGIWLKLDGKYYTVKNSISHDTADVYMPARFLFWICVVMGHVAAGMCVWYFVYQGGTL